MSKFNALYSFEFLELMEGPQRVSESFKVMVGSITLVGVDYWRFDEEGLIQEMTMLWCPLQPTAAV